MPIRLANARRAALNTQRVAQFVGLIVAVVAAVGCHAQTSGEPLFGVSTIHQTKGVITGIDGMRLPFRLSLPPGAKPLGGKVIVIRAGATNTTPSFTQGLIFFDPAIGPKLKAYFRGHSAPIGLGPVAKTRIPTTDFRDINDGGWIYTSTWSVPTGSLQYMVEYSPPFSRDPPKGMNAVGKAEVSIASPVRGFHKGDRDLELTIETVDNPTVAGGR
jgi:hypothetical protein